MAKRREEQINIEELLKISVRQVQKEKAMDYNSPLNIIDFSEKLLKESLSAGQRVIVKFFYAGSRFNEDLKIDDNDLKIINSFDIEQTWITYGEDSKIKWHEKYSNEERRKKEYSKRKDIYEREIKGEFVPEEEKTFSPLWFLDLILVLGRRSGKSYLSALISSYEAYKLLMLKDPQEFYKINSPIYIINTATSAEQAESIIFTEVKRFIRKCPAFDGRIGKNTQDELHILTNKDLAGFNTEFAEDHMIGSIVLKSGSSNSAGLRGKSAICLDGNSLICGENGYFRIEDGLKNIDVGTYSLKEKLYGANGIHETTNFIKRIDNIYDYKFSDGTILSCTKDHKIFVKEGNNIVEKTVKDLNENSTIVKSSNCGKFSLDNFIFSEEFKENLPHFTSNHEKNETCKICGNKYVQITNNHIKSHGISYKEYTEKFGKENTSFYKNRIRDTYITFPKECDNDLASILGYLISEGNYSIKNSIKFITTDFDVAKDYCNKIKKIFNIDIEIKTRKRDPSKPTYKTAYICDFANDKIKYFLSKTIGLENKLSKSKIIPACIFKSKKETIISFLKSLFEGDGIQGKKNIQYCTISKRLALDVSFLLNELDINNNISCKKIKSGNDFYRVTMYNFFAKKYYNTIGFFSSRRNNYSKFEFKNKYTRYESIKLTDSFLIDVKNIIILNKFILDKKSRNNLLSSIRDLLNKKQNGMSRNNFNLIKEILHLLSDESKKEFELNNKFKFVKFIKSDFIKSDFVYDFSFENDKDKSFFADGILNHNCVIYDEMAHFVETNGSGSGKEVYSALSRSSATYKMLGDGRQIVLSSPYTPSGKFYDLYLDGKVEPTILMFQVPTWNINPRVPKSILESEFRQDPESAATEYGARFLRRVNSLYFPPEKVDLSMERGRVMQSKGNPAYQYYLHIDAAETSDRYAFLLAHSENRFDSEIRQKIEYCVEDYSYFIKPKGGVALDPDFIVDEYILPLFYRFNIVCTSFDGIFTREQRKKIQYKCSSLLELRFAGRQKFNIYSNTRNLFMSNRIELCSDDVELQGELKNIIIDHSKKDPSIVKNPDSKDYPDDDLCDCLCGVCYAMTLGRDGVIGLPKLRVARTGAR